MKTSLDDMIKNNAGRFDTNIPPTGHFERFEQRLERHKKRRDLHWRRWVTVTSVAAIVTIVLMFQYTQPAPSHVCVDSIAEVRNFYGSQLKEEFEQVEKQMDYLDPVSKKELKEDLQAMQNDMPPEPKEKMADEEQIALIVLRYNAQMESLRHIQAILDKENLKN